MDVIQEYYYSQRSARQKRNSRSAGLGVLLTRASSADRGIGRADASSAVRGDLALAGFKEKLHRQPDLSKSSARTASRRGENRCRPVAQPASTWPPPRAMEYSFLRPRSPSSIEQPTRRTARRMTIKHPRGSLDPLHRRAGRAPPRPCSRRSDRGPCTTYYASVSQRTIHRVHPSPAEDAWPALKSGIVRKSRKMLRICGQMKNGPPAKKGSPKKDGPPAKKAKK